MGRKRKVKSGQIFNERHRRKIIEEYLNTGCSKREIWYKYTGQEVEHGKLLTWMRQLGYTDKKTSIKTSFVSKDNHNGLMAKKKQILSAEEIENIQLQKRVAELEKQLKDAELKAIAFSTMVDIAEREFKIPIRKKLNTKP
jgi:transposase